MSTLVREAWYIIALSSELKDDMVVRTVLDVPIVVFRDPDGSAVALHDRCPHRFAPLHLGQLSQGVITCAYHGLRFGSGGACVGNPHGDGNIPQGVPVRAYPMREQQGLLWIWMGEKDYEEDPPTYEFLPDVPDVAVFSGYIPSKANYLLMIDNIMDLSHADFLHSELLGTGGALTGSVPKISTSDDRIESSWEWEGGPAMGLFKPFLQGGGERSRGWLKVDWSSPALMTIRSGASSLESPDEELTVHALHAMTPQDERHTHYFYVVNRSFHRDDANLTKLSSEVTHKAFAEEDKPMIEAVQRSMGDSEFWQLRPWLLSGDGGVVRIRRALERRVRAEKADSTLTNNDS